MSTRGGGGPAFPPPAHEAAGPGRADWPVPAELELQELCADATESEELDELWASLLIFITLFLLSVSYGATSTLFKVKWVLATVLQEKPQAARDYANIVRPAQ
ncbi:Ig gamma-3 chain C region [Vulpes lagopus]